MTGYFLTVWDLRDKTSAEDPKAKEPTADPKGKRKANAPGGLGFTAKGSGTQQNLALVDTVIAWAWGP